MHEAAMILAWVGIKVVDTALTTSVFLAIFIEWGLPKIRVMLTEAVGIAWITHDLAQMKWVAPEKEEFAGERSESASASEDSFGQMFKNLEVGNINSFLEGRPFHPKP